MTSGCLGGRGDAINMQSDTWGGVYWQTAKEMNAVQIKWSGKWKQLHGQSEGGLRCGKDR